ncbi:Eco57I restriction-modification methylase domain-containing protein [Minwuia thermotolerans]|uniref:site-specific DNA-methyltransferase (adenine-specific) n=1 Tax=Minwuia thermotolerans TaxID=2056226 RepID=A0A2M9FW49_9PROT|nr:restriction endonuclease [Minwuia thermotolerans]PJK27698.1 restriction endonuclease [Minwuia thermotolerans]
MPADRIFQGSLFTHDLLQDSVAQLPDWQDLDDNAVDALGARLRAIFDRFPVDKTPNESQTEDDLIWPVLAELGWTATLRQQNLAARGREDVPDGLLFADDQAKARANRLAEEWRRYGLGLAIVESKRWLRPLDRRSGRRGEEIAPSTQMLRYLRRAEDLAEGSLRWGILTNGARWRLYWQGARSVSEQFFEVDLATVLDLPDHNQGLFALDADERRHWLKLFVLVFQRDAFLPAGPDPRTFHQRALEEGRFYEQRVAGDLSELVFVDVFPELARAIAAAAPDAPFEDVREAALVFLYRLLFILYAEDRDLLPIRDPRYGGYGLRENVRRDVGRRKDQGDVFSPTAARYWGAVDDLCRAISHGDPAIGLPPYNGGLFDPDRTPLLARIRIGDAVMAHVVDRLSFERTGDGRKYINYRDLGVRQLGSIYERLLEHEIARDGDGDGDGDGIVIRPNIFARKSSGSYYTPDDLVGLILRETVGPLADRPMESFMDKVDELAAGDMPDHRRIAALKGIDPASRILDLKVCDPAMGSGHFLVGLVDALTDHVLAAMADAELLIPAEWGDYVSPLSERIDHIRVTIQQNAERRGWTVDDEQLDDRHIVRRMVLKRCVYGVDKNPMAVELAKVSLWLHTFTVGAPLSFLDHHLRCGDSLFGAWVKAGLDRAKAHGGPLFLAGPVERALRAASPMQIIEGLTDAEIAEAHRSADVFAEVEEMTAPLAAFLSFVHALEWLDIRDAEDRKALDSFFNGALGDPVAITHGTAEPNASKANGRRFTAILDRARTLIAEERFLAWQVAFPGIWQDWEGEGLTGGFDAVIGNPPWDRVKLQQVEWFAARRREIAMQQRAADRKRMIAGLQAAGDPLAADYDRAANRAETAARVARKAGDYPLLSGGDVNLYSLFVERAFQLVNSDGYVGILVPSGIASDQTSSKFFKQISTGGMLRALYDFENKGTKRSLYFPDVHAQFKFCTFISTKTYRNGNAKCAFFINNTSDLNSTEKVFEMSPDDFNRVNPNTGTAAIF